MPLESCDGAHSSDDQQLAGSGNEPALTFRPLTPALMDALGAVLRGNFGADCWCMYPRLSDTEMRELPGEGSISPRRRVAVTELAGGNRAPGSKLCVGCWNIGHATGCRA